MDLVLNVADEHVLSPYLYPASWPEDWWPRQVLSLLLIVNVSGYLLYFTLATLSYVLVYDHRLLRHRRILPQQVRMRNTPPVSRRTARGCDCGCGRRRCARANS